MNRADATPVYRGYRHQAIYVLNRVLTTPNCQLYFAPEDIEDLAIYSPNGELLEVVQVKSYTRPLTMGDLQLSKPNGFVSRSANLLSVHGGITVRVVSFGPVGTEIEQIANRDTNTIRNVTQKIEGHGHIDEDMASRLLEVLEIETIKEATVLSEIRSSLYRSGAVVDPELVLDQLIWLVFSCSENKEKLTVSMILERLFTVGRFVNDRAAAYEEWYASVVPLDRVEVSEEEIPRLREEFSEGVSTRFEHILAGLDAPRPDLIKKLEHSLGKSQIAILIGASGQGKSTTMLRYLYDHFPAAARFIIRNVSDTKHGVNVASALRAHISAFGMPICIGVDVAPSDRGWTALVQSLLSLQNVFVIVAIRPDDFLEADTSQINSNCEMIAVRLSRAEAEVIFKGLDRIAPNIIDFEDAWNRAGGSVPMLEFMQICTQDTSLRARIESQVNRLQMRMLKGEIQDLVVTILEIVSIASETDSRILLKSLRGEFSRSKVDAAVRYLIDSFLIREDSNGTQHCLVGLHPIRSKYVLELLNENPDWKERISLAITHMMPIERGQLLLHYLDNGRISTSDVEEICHSVAVCDVGGVLSGLRALIWSGLYAYVHEQESLSQEIFNDSGRSWMVMYDSDIAGVNDGATTSLQQSFDSHNPARGLVLRDFRDRQVPKSKVFESAKVWLRELNLAAVPIGNIDVPWLPEIGFWMSRCHMIEEFRQWIRQFKWEQSVLDSEWESLTWLMPYMLDSIENPEEIRSLLVHKISQHFGLVEVVRDQDTVHAVMETQSSIESLHLESNQEMHDFAVLVLKYVSALFPENESVAFDIVDLNGELCRLNSMPRFRLFGPWGPALNHTFLDLVERPFLPKSFREFVLASQAAIISFARELNNIGALIWRQYQSGQTEQPLALPLPKRLSLYNAGKGIRQLPRFPNTGQMADPLFSNDIVVSLSLPKLPDNPQEKSELAEAFDKFRQSAEYTLTHLCRWVGLDDRITVDQMLSSRHSMPITLCDLTESSKRFRYASQMALVNNAGMINGDIITEGCVNMLAEFERKLNRSIG